MPSRSTNWPVARSFPALLIAIAGLVCIAPAEARDPLWDALPWDQRLGVSWYEQRAAQGDLSAQLRAAQMHEEGIGTAADPAEAARWYAAAAEQGHPLALFKTAQAWQTGLLGAPDQPRAAALYRAAADAGVGAASFNLAVMAETGQGLRRDRTKAAELYEQAWRQGLAKAALNLGILQLSGGGDPLVAYGWLAAAARAEVPGAAAQRDRLGDLLGSEALSEAEALVLPPLGGG
ncbi:tetratricopeptide repeat protein [Algihabitans albus]|uniref:tetratricopeptide repeat protein n=1 Tax=Algihabitans albus TaxID=2164067 RepID=UPI000E5C9797|nr:SEL1-like repeat protein [Algihabitans albus]